MRSAERDRQHLLKFLLPSLLGLALFLTPVPYGESLTIPVALLARALVEALGEHSALLIAALVVLSAVGALWVKLFQPPGVLRRPFLDALLNVPSFWLGVRMLGALFCLCCYFSIGPDIVHSSRTGGLLLSELLPMLLAVFLLAGLLLPLLLDFGLLEMVSAVMTPVMRPLFNLPGRSAIDCAASWLGDGSIGILLTGKQYESGFYTRREAAIIATNFSAVSITFCLVVITQVRLEHLFWQFYSTVCVAGLAAALLVPRLPPLSRKPDQTIGLCAAPVHREAVPEGWSALSVGFRLALERARLAGGFVQTAQSGLRNAADMVVGVLPVVMAIGTLALILAEFTPLFQYLGKPMVPLLEWMRVPEPAAVSETLLVGFADMFIPSIMAASIDNEMSRFIVATLSVTQLIYMSEVGALLLGSRIPIGLGELVAVFLLRTAVTLPVIVLMAHAIVGSGQ